MGPPPFGSGNTGGTVFDRLDRGELQWGHRLSAVETATAKGDAQIKSVLQWGHRLSAVETSTEETARMVELIGLQWGHRLSAVETAWLSRKAYTLGHGFNGATAFRQWKREPHYPKLDSLAKASMGPPPFGSGNRYLCPDSDFNPWDRAASAANTSGTRGRFISA